MKLPVLLPMGVTVSQRTAIHALRTGGKVSAYRVRTASGRPEMESPWPRADRENQGLRVLMGIGSLACLEIRSENRRSRAPRYHASLR
jgi:hypothetical protein